MSKKWLAIALWISLMLNITGLGIAGFIYLRRHQTGLYTRIYTSFLMTYQAPHTILLGDSQADNLNAYLKKDGVLAITIPGITILELKNTIATVSEFNQPAKGFILVGINDLRYGRSAQSILQDYNHLLEQIFVIFRGTQWHIISLLPLIESADLNNGVKNTEIEQVNRQLKNLADRTGCIFLDCFEAISYNGQLPATYSFDGLHLNHEGNQQLIACIGGYL